MSKDPRELDRHSPVWEVMQLLFDGHKNLTDLENCYDHTMDDGEKSISYEEVECMIRELMPEKDFRVNVVLTVKAKAKEQICVEDIQDAFHALATEAGRKLFMEHVAINDAELAGFAPRGQCHECGSMIGPTAGYTKLINGDEYHTVCYNHMQEALK